MKKYLLFLAVFMVILSLVSCSFEPIVTTYGDSVHEAVKEHYETYEILWLVRLENLVRLSQQIRVSPFGDTLICR